MSSPYSIGCSRIAFNHSIQNDGLQVFTVQSSPAFVKETIHAWISQLPNAKVLLETEDYVYATRLNRFLGVPGKRP